MPPSAAEYLLRNLAAASEKPVAPTDDFNDLLGRPPMSYSAWLECVTDGQ